MSLFYDILGLIIPIIKVRENETLKTIILELLYCLTVFKSLCRLKK